MDLEFQMTVAGASMDIRYKNRTMYFDTVQERWIVRRYQGSSPKNILIVTNDFESALIMLVTGKATEE